MILNKKVLYRKIKYYPIIIVEIYLWSTIFLYAYGPWSWATKYKITFYLLLCSYNFSLFLGYFIGTKHRIIMSRKYKDATIKSNKAIKYLNIVIYLFLFLTMLNCIRAAGLSAFSPTAYIYEVIKGLSDPAMQYYKKFNLDTVDSFGGPILSYINVLLSPFLWPVVPLSVYYFDNLTIFYKCIFVFSMLLEISRWIAIGTNKGIFDIAIIVTIVLLIKYVLFRMQGKKNRNMRFTKFYILLILYFAVTFFVTTINDRINGITANVLRNVELNQNSFLLQIIPHSLRNGFILLSSYLTQGYYGLSLALGERFTSTFGIGNSMFLIENFKELFGIDVFERTYQYKLAFYGWDPLLNWHTFYLWIANDVSLFGVIIVMFVIGYFFAYTWKDFILNSNVISLVLICLFSVMFIYIPANNQLLSYPTTFMAFWGIFFYWYISKKL